MHTNIDTVSRLAINTESEFGQTIVFRGHVEIKVIEDGREWIHFDGPNCLTNGGRTNMAYLLAEGPATRIVNTMKLGDGPDPEEPQPPAATDTDLDNVLHTMASGTGYVGYTYLPTTGTPTETSVKFSFHLEKNEGNGGGTHNYTEAGLYTSGGVMFARETFERLVKNDSRKIIFSWSILF